MRRNGLGALHIAFSWGKVARRYRAPEKRQRSALFGKEETPRGMRCLSAPAGSEQAQQVATRRMGANLQRRTEILFRLKKTISFPHQSPSVTAFSEERHCLSLTAMLPHLIFSYKHATGMFADAETPGRSLLV